MNFWLSVLRKILALWVRRKAARQLKRQGALILLKTLQTTRLTIAGIIALALTLQLMALGLIGAAAVAVHLMPLEAETRLWILFGLFSALFLIPLVALGVALSERVWYRASGADRLVDTIVDGSSSES